MLLTASRPVPSSPRPSDDLPPHVCGRYGEVLGPSIAASESMRAWGSRYARLVFERCGRNKRAAARYLDISYHTLEAYLGYGYTPAAAAGTRTPGWARLHRMKQAGEATVVADSAHPPDDAESDPAHSDRTAQNRAGNA